MPSDPLVPARAGTLKQLPDIAKRVGVHYRADLLVADNRGVPDGGCGDKLVEDDFGVRRYVDLEHGATQIVEQLLGRVERQ